MADQVRARILGKNNYFFIFIVTIVHLNWNSEVLKLYPSFCTSFSSVFTQKWPHFSVARGVYFHRMWPRNWSSSVIPWKSTFDILKLQSYYFPFSVNLFTKWYFAKLCMYRLSSDVTSFLWTYLLFSRFPQFSFIYYHNQTYNCVF